MYGTTDLIAQGSNSDIDTAEEDIVVVTEPQRLTNSQLSIFIDYALGTNTSLTFRFYVLRELGGSTWYQLPRLNESDGTLDPGNVVVDASSPADRVVYEMPLPACYGFKVAGIGAGGANSTATVTILSRDN